MKNPPSGVKLVMRAICIMLDVHPEIEGKPVKKEERDQMDYWPAAKKLLSDSSKS